MGLGPEQTLFTFGVDPVKGADQGFFFLYHCRTGFFF